MKKNLMMICCLLFTSPLFSAPIENHEIQTKIRTALSQQYSTHTATELRLCTYGECTITLLGTGGGIATNPFEKPRVGGDLDDALEVSMVIGKIFESAGDVLKPESKVNVYIRRFKNEECSSGSEECESKTLNADITVGSGGVCPPGG